MPFKNMTNDTTWNIWEDGIQFNLITSLSNSADLKVRQTESINNVLHSKGIADYALITPSIARTVSEKLDANVFIFGNINAADGKIRINAQLIDSKTEEVFKSFHLEGDDKEMLVITDSLASLIQNFLVLSVFKQEISVEFQTLMPNSVEAYKSFILGYKAFFKFENLSAIKWFSQSIELDSNYVYAYIWLSLAYANQGLFDQAEKWCLKVYQKKERLPLEQRIWINLLYARYHEKSIDEEIKYAKQLLEFDDRLPLNHWALALPYYQLNQYNNAIPELETIIQIYKSWNTKPLNSGFYAALMTAYHETGRYKEEKKLMKIAISDFPGDLNLIKCQIILCLTEKDTVAANQNIEKYISIIRNNLSTDSATASALANIYELAGVYDKAESYYRKAQLTDPDNPDILYGLANFLINSNKNPGEGLDLINEALVKSPENSHYLDTKGWGLFKLGRYQEALKILEKSDSLKPVYNHAIFLHIQVVKKAIADKK
jgi:tetratricopeptide (TPR) repeat protein